jgi:hypothetical protein
VPHPEALAEACFEVVQPAIAPDVDGVEVLPQLLEAEEEKPHVQHEMVVVLVALRAVADEVDVLSREAF